MSLQLQPDFGPLEQKNADALIALAMSEDLGDQGDITANATIPADAVGAAWFVARTAGVVAGIPVVRKVAERFELEGGWRPVVQDGAKVSLGQKIARIEGPMRALLSMERTALNFLQRLSGIATLTNRFVEQVAGTKAVILDTRKTTPGWRFLEKYAVRCGGAQNHRLGLFDAVLIKDNHLAWLGREPDAIGRAIAAARQSAPQARFVEVEVDTLFQFDEALRACPDFVLVDNLGPDDLKEAVARRDQTAPSVLLEASGGVTLTTVASLAHTGVDRISVGALTHSSAALDIGLDFEVTQTE